MLEVKDLVVNYGSIAALHGQFRFAWSRGPSSTLVGANGAGKDDHPPNHFRNRES